MSGKRKPSAVDMKSDMAGKVSGKVSGKVAGEDQPSLRGKKRPFMSLVQFAQRILKQRPVGVYRSSLERFQSGSGLSSRVEYLGNLVRKVVAEFLARNGGFRNLNVVRGRRRVQARIWDERVWSTIDLRLTSFCLDLLCFTYELAGRKQWAKRIEFLPGDNVGDEVFAYCLLDQILRSDAEWSELFASRDDKDGPVARLRFARFALADIGLPDCDDISRLQQPDWAVVMTYLDRYLAKGWFRQELQRRGQDVGESQVRYQNFGCFLEAWVKSALEKSRKDLLLPVVEYFVRALEQDQNPNHVIALYETRAQTKIPSASKQQEFLNEIGRIYKIGETISEAYEDCVDLAFIERTAPDHVFMAHYHKRFAPIADDIRFVGRHLLGEVG